MPIKINKTQKQILINFIKDNPVLLKVKFTNNFTKQDYQKLWCQISEILNSVPGPHKNWKQWKKVIKNWEKF